MKLTATGAGYVVSVDVADIAKHKGKPSMATMLEIATRMAKHLAQRESIDAYIAALPVAPSQATKDALFALSFATDFQALEISVPEVVVPPVYVPPAPRDVVTTETQQLACDEGEAGVIIQERTVTTTDGVPDYDDWVTVLDTCAVIPTPEEETELSEFVGPLTGWRNLATVGATGVEAQDSTSYWNTALSTLGTTNNPDVLYVPAGTYRITSTITVSQRQNITIIGEDPNTTTLIWDGAALGTMFSLIGVNHHRFCRFTVKGTDAARIIDCSKPSTGVFDTGGAFTDNIFEDADFAIAGGMTGHGFAEQSILRNIFRRTRRAGVFLGNSNALDIWVRDNRFEQCARAAANYCDAELGQAALNGAGAFRLYDNVMLGSTVADMHTGNTGIFSARNNFSLGSKQFWLGRQTGNPCNITLQGNTILDTTLALAIDIQNQGPVSAYDNITRNKVGNTTAAWKLPDYVGIGNTFTVASPITALDRSRDVDQVIVDRSTINPATPAFVGFVPKVARTVVEVAAAASTATIQTAINSATQGQRTVIHLPKGTYSQTAKLTLPANADLQLVGDGMGTVLVAHSSAVDETAMLEILGPSKVILRELKLSGTYKMQPVKIIGCDQVGARLLMFGTHIVGGSRSLDCTGLNNLVIEGYNFGHNYQFINYWPTGIGIKVSPGGSLAGHKVNIWSGATASQATSVYVTGGGKLLYRDTWYEGESNKWLQVIGTATVTIESNRIASTPVFSGYAHDIQNLNGKVSYLGTTISNRINVSGTNVNGKVLMAAGATDYYYNAATHGAYFLNVASPAGTAKLLNSRHWNAAGGGSSGTTNIGTTTDQEIRDMYAHTRGEAPMATPVDAGVSDIRMFKVWMQESWYAGVQFA